jgi:hypothetical protein
MDEKLAYKKAPPPPGAATPSPAAPPTQTPVTSLPPSSPLCSHCQLMQIIPKIAGDDGAEQVRLQKRLSFRHLTSPWKAQYRQAKEKFSCSVSSLRFISVSCQIHANKNKIQKY